MSRRGLGLFVLMCLIWGIPYLLIRVALREVSPAVLVFARTAIGGGILLPVALARGGLRALRGKWIPLIAFAVAEIGGPWFFLTSAEQHISSSLAALLISAVPLVAMVVAPLFGNRERIGPLGVGGLVLGLAGVVAIVGLDLGASSATALIQMALVAVGYAVGPAILKRYLSDVPGAIVMGFALAMCAVAYAPFAVSQWPSSVPGPDVLASLVILALVCTAAAFLLFSALIGEIGPVRATLITYINPAVAALAGVIVLHEALTVGMGVGFALVVAGSALASFRRPPKPASAAPGGSQE